MPASVYKICDCRDALRCKHSWWFSMSRRGAARIRASLDLVLERHIESKTQAEAYARDLRTEIAKGDEAKLTARQRELLKLPAVLVPSIQLLTVGQLLTSYEERHISRLATKDKQRYQVAMIKRTQLPRTDGQVLPFGDWLVAEIRAGRPA
jgi:hypothetical protein